MQDKQQQKLSTSSRPIDASNKESPFLEYDKVNYISLQCLEMAFQDSTTCLAYQRAIKQNCFLFLNKKVLHLTQNANCLYSIFAAEAGAKEVYCVLNGHCEKEQQNLYMMQRIIETQEGGLQKVVKVMSYKDFHEEIDIIIGEPMGHCLYFDSLVDRMIEAKDLYLKKGTGIMIPDTINFKCALIRDQHYIDRKSGFWDKVYNIKMSSMKQWIANEPIIRIVDPSLLISETRKFLVYNLETVRYEDLERLHRNFQLDANEEQTANGLVVWFEIEFNHGSEKIEAKASPWTKPARWTHSTFYSNTIGGWKLKPTNKVSLSVDKNFKENSAIIKLKVNQHDQIYSYAT